MESSITSFGPGTPWSLFAEAVGLLFLSWAKLENEMAASLRLHLSRQLRTGAKKGEVVSAVYGSMRMKNSRDTMKRLAQELDYGEKCLKWHQEFFTHIGHLEDFRDKLAHQLARPVNATADGQWKVSDIVTTRTWRSVKEYHFDTEAVTACGHDINLAAHSIGDFLKKGAKRSAPALPPWRYKPSMLKLQQDKMQSAHQELLRLRRSSRASKRRQGK
jgi:hypothetical protein